MIYACVTQLPWSSEMTRVVLMMLKALDLLYLHNQYETFSSLCVCENKIVFVLIVGVRTTLKEQQT